MSKQYRGLIPRHGFILQKSSLKLKKKKEREREREEESFTIVTNRSFERDD